MSSRLIGILLVVALLMIFLVIGGTYKESFVESEEDGSIGCGSYYWDPRTILTKPIQPNPIDAILSYESHCRSGTFEQDSFDYDGSTTTNDYVPVWLGMMMMMETPRVLLNDSFNRQLLTKNSNPSYINFQLDSPNNIIIVKPGTYRLVVNRFNLANPSQVNVTVTIIKQNTSRDSSMITAPGIITLGSLDKDDKLQIKFKGPSSEIVILDNPVDYQFKLEFSTRSNGDVGGGGGS